MGFSGSALGQLVNILPIPRPADAGKVLMAIGAGTAGWASTTSLVTDAVKISLMTPRLHIWPVSWWPGRALDWLR